MTKAAIIQSSYIPWRGYFNIIADVDHFIFLDDVQYTRRDWRSRNCIKGSSGPIWLTIPVHSKGLRHQRIAETIIAEPGWWAKHWRSIELNYTHAAAFGSHGPLLEAAYRDLAGEERLSQINRHLTEAVCRCLDITTRLAWSTDFFDLDELKRFDPSERLLRLCQAVGADTYISGPSAACYLDVAAFATAGVRIEFADYSGYPPYRQLFGEFLPAVSIVDLLLNEGASAPDFMKIGRLHA